MMLIDDTSFSLTLLSAACIGLLAAASAHDVVARTVPNSVALLLAVAGVASAVLRGSAGASLLSAGGLFVAAALCWRCGWMGGGDVKLLGAAALGMAPAQVPAFVGAVAVAGGGLAVLYLAVRPLVGPPAAGRPDGLLARALRAERWRIRRGGALPYACAIAAGFAFVNL